MKSADIIKYLFWHYKAEKWARFAELRLGSGYGFHERRIDFLAVDIAPSRGNKVIAYEVKVSRADFRRDIANEKKQRGAKLYSNEFFFIAPEGVIPQNEVPDWAGLAEIHVEKNPALIGYRTHFIKTTIPAPYREKWRPSWPLMVSIARNARKQGYDQGVKK